MNIEIRLFIIGLFLVITSMAVATQYANLGIIYDESEHEIIIPKIPDTGMRYIGSDNSTDGKRLYRLVQDDNESYKIFLGNFSMNFHWTFTAAIGIVNEDNVSKHITKIEILPSTANYLKLWLHGDRDGNAANLTDDPSGILMYDTGTIVSNNDTIAWTLAPGDGNESTICSNITDRLNNTDVLKYDEIAGVRYTFNNADASSNLSDFVWIQIELEIPDNAPLIQAISGYLNIFMEAG